MNATLRRLTARGVLALTLLTATGGTTSATAAPTAPPAGGSEVAAAARAPGIAEIRAIAEAGFIYGLPLVMNYAVQYEFTVDKASSQYKAPLNTLHNERRVLTYADTTVVTPNSDTPYSMAWLDLRAEPMVITVPAIERKRYYSVQLIDGSTDNYGYIGSRATGNGGGRRSTGPGSTRNS